MPCNGKTSTATARERELYRYWQPEDDAHTSSDPCGPDSPAPRSSSDPILTAFAQLGALRLNAKRGMITLTTRDNEYIIAEAGKTLSIQEDDDEQDRLWHGVATMKSKGLGHDLVKLFCDADAPLYAVFNDVSKVEFLKDRKFVKESPFVKFIACVPLRTPGSLVIGNYMIADDQPRDGLSESEIQFMTDMGVTVMDYLEAGRVKRKQYRAERMVKAMGLFIEGRTTLREWWLQVGHQAQHAAVKKRTHHEIPLEKQADLEFGIQDPVDEFTAKGLNGLHPHESRPTLVRSPSSSTLSHSVHGDPKSDGRPFMPQRDSMFSSSNASTYLSQSYHDRNSSVTTFDGPTEQTLETEERHHSVAFDLPPENVGPDTSKELQDVLFSSDLKGVFARASNLIREAIAVDGVLFLDASIGSFGGSSEKDVMEEKAPGAFDAEKLTTSSDDDQNGRRPSEPEISGDAVQEATTQPTNSTEKSCNILGFSTRRRSSLRGHAPHDEHKQFPETVLRRLLKRYPHGKVFNFEEDGSFSSSDSDHAINGYSDADANPHKPGAHERKAQRKRLSREAEAKAILSVLPKARSVFWFPLWDQSKERWFAGSLVWSTTPTRVFCPVEDLTYLAAFGNSVMAEVSRLSAQVLAQMKTDFISSISHELRSPLHGVLASVEFLQETSLNEVQTDMVYNIQASAKVLLDTLNHVLDFSKVNRKSKNKGLSPAFRTKRSKKVARSDPEKQSLDNTAEDIANVCVLSEEVVESIYAGRSINKRAFDAGYRQRGERPHSMSLDSPLTVIMDVNYHPSWKFEIDAGAWRRILMNLFSNALKYTKTGFVQVSLQVESDALSRSKRSRSILTLKVKDSGKGISQEFLKHRLFKPFTQEDSLAAGAGLGLSIVRHIVHDLGGEINFVSEQGAGTEATVRIPLTSIPASNALEQEVLSETKNETKGLKFSLEGFDRYPDISETPTGILSSETEAAMLLKSSVHSFMTEWFEMEPATTSMDRSTADVVVILESGFGGKSVGEILQTYHCALSPVAAKSIAIVITTTYPTGPKIHSQGRFKVFYLPQPYGPHKVAKILHSAFCSTRLSEIPQAAQPETVTPHSISIPQAPVDFVSPKSNPSPIFPDHLPTRRHSVQPSSKSIALALQSQLSGPLSPSLTQLPEIHTPTEPQSPAQPQAEKVGRQDSWERISGDPIVKDPNGMKVLLVEDNEINLKLLVAYMRKLKLDHKTAVNGLEAVNAYKEAHHAAQRFDVIFMDISMPVMSGIESTQHIRRFEREHGLEPVALIALTGAANPNTRQEAFSSGVDLFLTKPVPMKSLKVMLDELKANGRSGMSA